jgi:signal transduction histidine kinase/CheY-like chemotaxis protein
MHLAKAATASAMDETVLILTPHGRDSSVAVDLLRRHGIPAFICEHLNALSSAIEQGAGAALVAEEALAGADLHVLAARLEQQPPWSDFPFVVLANGHKGVRSTRAFETLDRLRNVVLLERPLHAESMVRAVRSALNARRRQYEARDVLAQSREELERLVLERTREREEALAQLHEAQKLETIGQLTGGVAHDFNNLLTPVMGNLDLLRRRIPADDSRSQRLVENALQATSRAATLVQRLLAFARRQDLQPKAVDVSELLAGIEDLVTRSIGPTIAVNLRSPPDLPAARVDPSQLELAVLNLAINARDAMPRGGVLTIEVKHEAVRPRPWETLKAGDYICVSVVDTGVGMDAATLKRAVEPFFSTKGIGKGTGLGLSMVHGLASQLGGALAIRSARKLGTNVELWLPQSTALPDATQPFSVAPSVARRTGTVLLVDDEDLVRLSTADMLIELGYSVVEASSAEEALKLVDRGLRPDLVVTDHLMPGISGTELARTLQSGRPGTKVLVVSGYAETEGIAPDLPRLTKPFRNADLAASLAMLSAGG